MNRIDYNKLMKEEIKRIKGEKRKPTLLLHSCCAPCSSSPIERLKDVFDLTLYFYNPNIDGLEEYNKRAKELERFCLLQEVKCVIEEFNSEEFISIAKGREELSEGGERCFSCYELRLDKTGEFAKSNGYEYFATTLTLSPLKNAEILNQKGKLIEEKYKVKYLPSDFKKEGGYLRSIELSKEHGLYRQNYCGCVYSKRLQP